ncbi:uncharacterized protein TNCV_1063771 [Trichonephila clavipes]|nr:uncharacterized protein TNCV_1063771 [Trichonephila clavipes]
MSIDYKQSLDNADSTFFYQPTSHTHLIEDETFNDGNIIRHFIDYEDGPEEPESFRVKKYMCKDSPFQQIGKHFLKIDTNFERCLKFQKDLRSCITGYRDVHKQLTNQPLSQKFIPYFMPIINQFKWYLQVTKVISI